MSHFVNVFSFFAEDNGDVFLRGRNHIDAEATKYIIESFPDVFNQKYKSFVLKSSYDFSSFSDFNDFYDLIDDFAITKLIEDIKNNEKSPIVKLAIECYDSLNNLYESHKKIFSELLAEESKKKLEEKKDRGESIKEESKPERMKFKFEIVSYDEGMDVSSYKRVLNELASYLNHEAFEIGSEDEELVSRLINGSIIRVVFEEVKDILELKFNVKNVQYDSRAVKFKTYVEFQIRITDELDRDIVISSIITTD